MLWMEIVNLKPFMPRKKRYAFCSTHRDAKTAVHTTINGKGRVGRLFSKG